MLLTSERNGPNEDLIERLFSDKRFTLGSAKNIIRLLDYDLLREEAQKLPVGVKYSLKEIHNSLSEGIFNHVEKFLELKPTRAEIESLLGNKRIPSEVLDEIRYYSEEYLEAEFEAKKNSAPRRCHQLFPL